MKIVFVLGAAANKELDKSDSMPIGSELARKIQDQLTDELDNGMRWPEGPISTVISSTGGLSDTHVQAMRRIQQGITHHDSIDKFIHEWSDQELLPEVAKIAISYEILKAESQTNFQSALHNPTQATLTMRSIRDSWLGQIFRYANPQVRRRDVSDLFRNISFITFNYDRCLEAAFHLFFRYGQGLVDSEVKAVAENLEIIHAYGCLGSLDEFGGTYGAGSEIGHWAVSKGAEKIRTFTEEVESEHSARISNCISEADKIVFLGFGFNDLNLKLLNPFGIYSGAAFATVYGMRSREIENLDNYMSANEGRWVRDEVECSQLLEQFREDIFEY